MDDYCEHGLYSEDCDKCFTEQDVFDNWEKWRQR